MQYTVFVKAGSPRPAEFEEHRHPRGPARNGVRLKDVARIELVPGLLDQRCERRPSGGGARDFSPARRECARHCKAIHEVMEEQSAHFPPGMNYRVPYTTTPFVKESLKEVSRRCSSLPDSSRSWVSVLQSWRATLIPILAVPISLVGTLAAFSALGFSINTLTLFGMVLAIGIVVDDAIVVVEAVQHRLDEAAPRR